MTTYAAESAARNIRSNHEDRDQDQTVPTVETLTRETHGMLERTGVRLSPSRVGRLCRDYVNIVATKGVSFGAYLANAVALTVRPSTSSIRCTTDSATPTRPARAPCVGCCGVVASESRQRETPPGEGGVSEDSWRRIRFHYRAGSRRRANHQVPCVSSPAAR